MNVINDFFFFAKRVIMLLSEYAEGKLERTFSEIWDLEFM